MTLRKNWAKRTLTLLSCSALLTACDSGSTGATAPTAEVLEGSFIDSPVSGLFFQTDTQSGLTDLDGTFRYQAGETVTFYIGATELGKAPGSEVLTPFDISGHRPLNTETEILNSFASTSASSYDKALNIANLLQQLDKDGNPENGIDLGNTHEQLSSLKIPLFVKASTFLSLDEIGNAQELTGASFQKSVRSVLDHLYTNLGIEVSASQLDSRITEDRATHFDYNNEGLVSSISFDADKDGNIDREQSFEYDQLNRLTSITEPLNAISDTLEYDDDSNLISRYRMIDSNLDSEESFAYQDGKLVSFTLDTNGNDRASISSVLNYNEAGLLSSISTVVDGNTLEDKNTLISYQGPLVTTYHEVKQGEAPKALSISYNHDANGNIIESNTQSTRDLETQIAISSFSYDDNNRPTRYELDTNQDGFPDYVETYRYNQQGKRIEYKKDNNGDGTWNFVAQYSYDIDGNRTKMIEDSDGNGIVDKVWQAEYQAATLENPWNAILEQL